MSKLSKPLSTEFRVALGRHTRNQGRGAVHFFAPVKTRTPTTVKNEDGMDRH